MPEKNKIAFVARMDEDMYKKFIAVAEKEGRSPNNHFLHLLRTNIAYYERIHGKLDTSTVELPQENESAE